MKASLCPRPWKGLSLLLCVATMLLLVFAPVVSAHPLTAWVEGVQSWWSFRTTIERVFLSIFAFLLFAGVTGLDGGNPKYPVVPLEEASSPHNPRVFMDVTVEGGKALGQITMELFATVVPQTAENFRCLCTGEKGKGQAGKKLHFKGSSFHRVIPGFMCQGGDVTKDDGTGGESIYGTKFADEHTNGYVAHTVPGLLGMANSGFNTNNSQFYITASPAELLDCRHVVFGRVEAGMEVIKLIEAFGRESGETSAKVVIQNCGEVKNKST